MSRLATVMFRGTLCVFYMIDTTDRASYFILDYLSVFNRSRILFHIRLSLNI